MLMCTDYASKAKTILDGYLEGYEGLCDMKKVHTS